MIVTKKDPNARRLGKLRWKDIPPEERTRRMRALALKRWLKKTTKRPK